MRTSVSVLFGAKNFVIFEFDGCVRNPHGQGEEVNFSRFCADIFYGRPFKIFSDGSILFRSQQLCPNKAGVWTIRCPN